MPLSITLTLLSPLPLPLSSPLSPESLQMTVTPDAMVTVHSQASSCTLCTGNATAPEACDATVVPLPPGEEVTLQFSCSETLGASYQARVQRTIGGSPKTPSPW